MQILRAATLLIASSGMGLMAGVFGIYANAIMPGLRDTDDRSFVAGFQSIDRAIINPVFLSVFFGTLVATAASIGLHLTSDHHAPLPWLVAAFVLYLAVIVITASVNVPLNDAIKASRSPHRRLHTERDPGTVRRGSMGPLEHSSHRDDDRRLRQPPRRNHTPQRGLRTRRRAQPTDKQSGVPRQTEAPPERRSRQEARVFAGAMAARRRRRFLQRRECGAPRRRM
jgi:uncharacterized membrane protein